MKHPVVDSHIHFWDTEYLSYAWLKDVPTINQPFLPEHLIEASAHYNLEKIVFVEAGLDPQEGVAEAAWVSELANHEPRIEAIVASAPLELGEAVKDHLDALKKFPLVKGVRRLIQAEALGFSTQPEFITGVQLLADYDFSFDICIYHTQLEDALRLVEACPDVSFVLDHIAKPNIKDGLLEPWAKHIDSLSRFPNVQCKLSGVVTEADHKTWKSIDLKPYVEHIINCFGVDRLMYGGDWPVSKLASSWTEWLETTEWLLSSLSEIDKQKIYYDNAVSFYKLSG